MGKIAELLTKARKLIAAPSHWTQGTYARDASGIPTNRLGPDAVCFCSIGAMDRALRLHPLVEVPEFNSAIELLNNAARTISPNSNNIVGFNDRSDTRHSDVLEVFDHAIKVASHES